MGETKFDEDKKMILSHQSLQQLKQQNIHMKNKITTLFLDIGGVLLSDGWGHNFRHKAAAMFNLDAAEMEARHKLVFVVYEEGRMTLDEYLEEVVFYEKRRFSANQFRDFMFAQTTPNPAMIDFIKKLKKKYGLQVAAVSNEARELNDYRIQTFRLKELIDFFISSCYVHIRKPDAEIFRLALDIARVQPEQVIYIDDVEMFTEVASELGIKSIHHVNEVSTANQIKAMGLPIEENEISYA